MQLVLVQSKKKKTYVGKWASKNLKCPLLVVIVTSLECKLNGSYLQAATLH